MKKSLATLVLIAGFAFFVSPLQASELYVGTEGNAKILDTEITSLNNNVITVTLWSTKWILFVDVADSNVKVTNASGEKITVWDLQKGHKIYVEGRIRESGPGKIDILVSLLRDLSISGKESAITTPSITQVVSVTPPPACPSVKKPSCPTPEPNVQVLGTTATAAPAPTSSAVTYSRLYRGMSGDNVKELQNILQLGGYLKEDEVTGFFGQTTENAVKKFQGDNGIAQEGFVGPLTHQALEGLRVKNIAAAPPAVPHVIQKTVESVKKQSVPRLTVFLKRGDTSEEVRLLQQLLLAEKYLKDDEVSGFFGPATEAAVKKFQYDNGIAQEGSVGPLTRELANSILADGRLYSSRIVPPVLSAETPVVPQKSFKTITRNLLSGMNGGDVVILQEFLQKNNWGIPNDGPVTGYYGDVTKRAVSKFQQANGLEAIGDVGSKTRELINSLLSR